MPQDISIKYELPIKIEKIYTSGRFYIKYAYPKNKNKS